MTVSRRYCLPIVLLVIFCGGLPSALDIKILVNQVTLDVIRSESTMWGSCLSNLNLDSFLTSNTGKYLPLGNKSILPKFCKIFKKNLGSRLGNQSLGSVAPLGILGNTFRYNSVKCTFCEFLMQDFVWGFALIIAGIMTILLPIGYGVTNFRQDLINTVSFSLSREMFRKNHRCLS